MTQKFFEADVGPVAETTSEGDNHRTGGRDDPNQLTHAAGNRAPIGVLKGTALTTLPGIGPISDV
jgi:hypothetical protein